MSTEKKVFVLDIRTVEPEERKAFNITTLLIDNENLVRERNGWRESAVQFSNGQEFYHGLIYKIGDMFGVAAKTADDGSVMEDVLALKVPELVEKLIKEQSENKLNKQR